MRIFYTSVNNEDGSSSTHFYESQECIDVLEEADPEGYAGGEGGSYFDVEGTTSLKIITLSEVEEEIEEMKEYL